MTQPIGRTGGTRSFVRALAWLLVLGAAVPLYAADPAGPLVVAGNGPELIMIERLARAFEKANPRAYIDVVWNEKLKPIDMVKSGQAQVAVTGTEEPGLAAAQIAWDGIAIMINLSNHTREISTAQLAELFSGKIRNWSELGGPETRVLLIDRPRHRNIRDAFEHYLGINGKIPDSAKVIGPDDKVIKTVAGSLPPLSPVTFISLGQALDAVSSGVAVRLLPLDGVEPEEPTVKDGRYKLRRPVLLVSRPDPSPAFEAFRTFALGPDGQRIIDAEGYTPFVQKP